MSSKLCFCVSINTHVRETWNLFYHCSKIQVFECTFNTVYFYLRRLSTVLPDLLGILRNFSPFFLQRQMMDSSKPKCFWAFQFELFAAKLIIILKSKEYDAFICLFCIVTYFLVNISNKYREWLNLIDLLGLSILHNYY